MTVVRMLSITGLRRVDPATSNLAFEKVTIPRMEERKVHTQTYRLTSEQLKRPGTHRIDFAAY
jgi:hypothetical protein